MTSRTLQLAHLVEDMSIYPRHALDSSHVGDLANALRAGHVLPPPVVQDKTFRIVDGWHRNRAYLKVLGPAGEIEVDARSYDDEAAVIAAAVEMNSAHGRRLDQQDRTRAALMLRDAGVSTGTTARILRTTEERVEVLTARVVLVRGESGTAEARPAKAVLWPRDGQPREVTEEQYEVQRSSSGLRPIQTVGQLLREVEGGVLDLEDAGLCARLWALHDAIARRVPRADAQAS